jgi:hypothetical protein
MANREPRSRAVAAAEKAGSGRRPPLTPGPDGRWTKAMVGRAILAFSEIERIPQFDDDAIRVLVRDFLEFVQRVDAGGVEDDAMPLARTFIARGYQWLAENPSYAPVSTKVWSLDMVEHLILWFNDMTTRPDRRRLFDVAERIKVFERVVRSGAVEPGEADMLAEAFLEYAHRWLLSQPDALAHYQAL